MTDHVPAPEQRGCDQLYEDAVESLRQAEAGERPTPREELRMKPVEQQGEPVCARCGHPEFAQDGSAVHISEREQDGGDDSDDWCVMCANEKRQIEYHPFEPAPPPSEEAEDVAEAKRRWRFPTPWTPTPQQAINAMHFAFVSGSRWRAEREAAIRAPLEERVRELEARPGGWYEAGHDDAVAALEPEIKALEEERDRLRALYDEACAAMDVLALHSAPRARAEAAEAQVHELRTALTEALTDIKDGWKDSAATVIRRALAAH